MNEAATQTAPNTVQLERLLDAPIDRVWEYLVDPVKRGSWFAAGPLEQRKGGALAFTFDHDNLSARNVPYPEKYLRTKGMIGEGHVSEFDPPHVIAFNWSKGGDDIARFELTQQGDKTRLVLTHSRLATREDQIGVASGWTAHLAALEQALRGERLPDFWAVLVQAEAQYEQAFPAD
jgi:uncharacterized protein YndB with AHSA1/START domain